MAFLIAVFISVVVGWLLSAEESPVISLCAWVWEELAFPERPLVSASVVALLFRLVMISASFAASVVLSST